MMTKGFFLAPAILLGAAISGAQVSGAPADPTAPAPKAQTATTSPDALPSGTILTVELSKSLDAKKLKADDKIEAKTAVDFLAHGQIVVPRNTKIIGHVTEAKAHSKTSADSMVGIAFDRMLLKDGREVPMQLTVQAVARPLQVLPNFSNTPPGDPGASGNMPGQRGPLTSAPSASGPSPYPGTRDPSASTDSTMPSVSTSAPLSPTSHGVVGIKGLALDTAGPVSVLSSNSGNVHLDGGAQLILRVQ